MDFLKVLEKHLKKYPKSEPTDAVKLAYQSALGPGHLIKDASRAREYFFSELERTETGETELYTEIGGDFVRVNLMAIKGNNQLCEMVFTAFLKTAENTELSRERLDKFLHQLLSFSNFPFPKEELTEYLNEYLSFREKNEIPPPVSHSDGYREAYFPHYRVVNRKFLNLEE